MQFHVLTFIAIPIISALIGWFTNFVAVKMIFRPRTEKRVLGLRIIGLIPKRKDDLAEKIAEMVEKELISHRDIRAIIQSDEFHDQTGKIIRSRIDEYLFRKVAASSLLSLLVPPDMIDRLSETIMEELTGEIPGAIDSLLENIESRFNFVSIIREKIRNLDIARLESIIYAISARELKSIEILGGVLGFVVGLIQVFILILGSNYGS